MLTPHICKAQFDENEPCRFFELFELLTPFQQKTVLSFVGSLLRTRATACQRDKSTLLNLSTWAEEDIQEIEDAQQRINQWQIQTF